MRVTIDVNSTFWQKVWWVWFTKACNFTRRKFNAIFVGIFNYVAYFEVVCHAFSCCVELKFRSSSSHVLRGWSEMKLLVCRFNYWINQEKKCSDKEEVTHYGHKHIREVYAHGTESAGYSRNYAPLHYLIP